MLRSLEIGADEDEHRIRLVSVRGPDLLPVQDVVVAVTDRPRLQAREIGAGARLGVTLAPADLAPHDGREMHALQLFAALVEQEWADHREAEPGEGWTEPELRHLLGEHARFRGREPAAAVLARPSGRRPAALGHDVEPAPHVVRVAGLPAAPAEVVGRAEWRVDGGRRVGDEPAPGLFTEGVEGHGRLTLVEAAG